MLTSTFQHLKGVGAGKEAALWKSGILTWADYDRQYREQQPLFALANGTIGHPDLEESHRALDVDNANYFARLLDGNRHYRIALTFPAQTVFLDIESTGLSNYYDHITLIGASCADRYLCHVRGDNPKALRDFLAGAKCLVTFNGTIFDLAFVRREFPDIVLPEAHVDLRFLGARVGLRGGQKTVERQIHLARSQEISEVEGAAAPLLWHDYKNGSLKALRTLVSYNHADVYGMKVIFDEAVDRALKEDSPALADLPRHRFADSKAPLSFTGSPKRAGPGRVLLRPYKGKRGPEITWKDLAEDPRVRRLRVVGIDLTGSERRPTGWCLLDRNRAITKLLRSDDDLIKATMEVQPDLISIDSPLSMPKGRVRATDDDPVRDEFGIMRQCERTLKKRGVNVYPCLLPSMQALTVRGTSLATRFRQLGIPVIESYPGAAQDIMGIPRKRASLDYLKQGLGLFGVKGDFLTEDVTHDEVDAVTSAIVGVFFWSGNFEALGIPEEDYLIIPDLKISPVDWRARRVVGISGPIAAGKTTAGQALATKGLTYGRYSEVLERILLGRGGAVNRRSLQKLGAQIHEQYGQRWLGRELVSSLPRHADLVIDGLRFPEDRAYLAESFGPAFLHLHVDAPEARRRERYIADGHSGAEFDEAIGKPVELQVPLLATRANAKLENAGAIEGFMDRVFRAIKVAYQGEAGRSASIGGRRRAVRLRRKGKGRSRLRPKAKRERRRTRRRT